MIKISIECDHVNTIDCVLPIGGKWLILLLNGNF